MENEITRESILNEAKSYMKTHKSATFNTYESFKRMAHSAGIYGIERELARILKI